jgi:hypothetical protein
MVAAAMLGVAMLIGAIRPALAQDSTPKTLTLWVDSKTGQLFTRPGKGRTPFVIPGAALDTSAIANQVEQKVDQKTATLEQTQEQMKADLAKTQQQTQDVSMQMAEVKPAWQDYIDNFKNKFRVGTLVYADYRFYTHTGFGPQELTQINAPGPGNNNFNSFDISRAYLNFYFNPTDDWTVRVTPNVYRANAGGTTADGNSANSSISSNVDDQLDFRLKYAYLQYSKLFDRVEPMKGDTVTFGQAPNPLVGWEEDLYGFRYVNLTPWNYLSLSSTQQGLSMQGPIKVDNLQYVDYDFGVYNDANFHQMEEADTKQVMGRVSVYPLGAQWRFDGLGITGFFNYGYSNVAPDETSVTDDSKHVTRVAGLLHYTTDWWGLAGEYDFGHNAFTTGNLWSSSGPSSSSKTFASYSAMSTAFQNNGKPFSQGFDFFGHLRIPQTPLTAFGMFEAFYPNTKVNLNPNDFQRFVIGMSYQYNEFLRMSLASQNLLYFHKQQDVPADEYNKNPAVTDAVPRDNHMIFLGAEFSY